MIQSHENMHCMDHQEHRMRAGQVAAPGQLPADMDGTTDGDLPQVAWLYAPLACIVECWHGVHSHTWTTAEQTCDAILRLQARDAHDFFAPLDCTCRSKSNDSWRLACSLLLCDLLRLMRVLLEPKERAAGRHVALHLLQRRLPVRWQDE
jgi:hypothetical protein